MKKVLCFVPNGHVIIGYLDTSKYKEFIHIKNASIVAQNNTSNSDYSQVILKGEPEIKKVEPLGKDVYINSMYINMSYMDDNAIIPEVNFETEKIISALDRRFLFQSDSINFDKLENWYVEISNNYNIKSYTWGKWLWQGKYELTKCGEKHLYSLYNLLFLVWNI